MSTFIAFSWIFVSRSVMGCREDSRGHVSEGRSKQEGPSEEEGAPWGWGRSVEPFLEVEGWSALLRGGREGHGDLGREDVRLCVLVPLRAAGHSNVGLVGAEDKQEHGDC